MRILIIAALALTSVGPAFAQAATTPAATQAATAKGEKKICKRLETSGTRMAERVCLTAEQWKKVEAEQG